MENFNEINGPITPNKETGSIISHALELFKNTFLYCFLAVIIYFILSYLVQLITGFDSTALLNQVKEQVEAGATVDYDELMNMPNVKTYTGTSILVSFLLAPIFVGLIYVANKSNFRQQISVGDIFFAYKQNFINVLLYTVISYVIMIVTLAMCFLPALFIMPLLFLGYPIILFENAGAIQALKKSFAIVKENYLTIVITAVLSAIISCLGVFLCCYGIYLTMPFLYIAIYSTYCAYCGTPRQL